jgi:hypothetical protein
MISFQVVHENLDAVLAEGSFDDRFDQVPASAGKAAADAGHVDGCVALSGFGGERREGGFRGFVADRWDAVGGAGAVLGDHVGDPQIVLDLNKLHGTEVEVVFVSIAVPFTISVFRLGPVFGDGDNESAAPAAGVVADVGDDLVPFSCRASGVAGDVVDGLHNRILPDVIGCTPLGRRELMLNRLRMVSCGTASLLALRVGADSPR